jgi:nucleoside-diphosphate-sugar epimerase
VGCGDVGLRVVRQLQAAQTPQALRVLALTSSPQRLEELRALGITPILGNLDAHHTLRRLAGLATRVLHLAPPPNIAPPSASDPRTLALLRALRLRSLPASLVYGSTTGVYGDRQGQWTPETTPPKPQTARAQRRVDAEQHLRWLGRVTGVRVSVLRIPGIYAPDREGGTPRERLLRGTPALQRQDDVYTNHIHANDLASACLAALWRAAPQRMYNVCDDSNLTMGEYFDLAAELFDLPKPERISRAEAQQRLSPMLLSFMSESRRLSNQRMKQELGLRLWYPKVEDGLRS